MRYRAGEKIFRASAPADKLYLVDKGNVRVQTLGGGAYLLGPGESFGERALITEQPHNTTVSADTDVDVWTLDKQDSGYADEPLSGHCHQHHTDYQPAHERNARCPTPAGHPAAPVEAALLAPPTGGRRQQAAPQAANAAQLLANGTAT